MSNSAPPGFRTIYLCQWTKSWQAEKTVIHMWPKIPLLWKATTLSFVPSRRVLACAIWWKMSSITTRGRNLGNPQTKFEHNDPRFIAILRYENYCRLLFAGFVDSCIPCPTFRRLGAAALIMRFELAAGWIRSELVIIAFETRVRYTILREKDDTGWHLFS